MLMNRGFVAPVVALAAALLGTIGDTHDSSGVTILGWAVIIVAIAGTVETIRTIAKQQGELKVKEEAWRRNLLGAVSHNQEILRYINFASRQYCLLASRLGSEIIDGFVHDVSALPYAWGDELPMLQSLLTEQELGYLRNYRVDPPRGIGWLWADPVPFGTDHRDLPTLVSEEIEAGIDQLRQVQDLYGQALEARTTNLISLAGANTFAKYLIGLPKFYRMRQAMEDSRYPGVYLVGRMGAPSESAYVEWVNLLDELRAIAEPRLRVQSD